MKILIVNTFDKGGAAKACINLHNALIEENVDSKLILKYKSKQTKRSSQFNSKEIHLNTITKFKKKIVRILKELKLIKHNHIARNDLFNSSRDKRLEIFNFPNSQFDITQSKLYEEADIINLHWVAKFIDYKSFFEKNTKPVVWTLHDMNAFTGGEHYSEQYLGIDDDGYPLKRILTEEEVKVSDENLQVKKTALKQVSNLFVVAPSHWLASEAKKSEVFKNKKVYHIPNGLDCEVYSPRDRDYSRSLLNIPKHKKVILFVSDSLDNNRKGFVFLKKAFEKIADSELLLCAVGEKNTELSSLNNIVELGPIYDERFMSVIYSMADVFVITSLMDNLPNTVLESLLCGTPVIGFPVGGIVDMIQEGENGYLTKDISTKSLVETLLLFLDNPNYFDRTSIREEAKRSYSKSVQAKKYIDLFSIILETKNKEV